MNPWKGADPESAEEAEERALFTRRARVLARGEVASLASVLRAARVSRDVADARGGRVRAIVAVTLAAACMTAAVTRLPGTQTRGAIAADIDASSPRPAVPPETAVHSAPASALTSGVPCSSSNEVLFSEEIACVSPTLFTSTSAASIASMTTFAPRQTPLASGASPSSLACEENE